MKIKEICNCNFKEDEEGKRYIIKRFKEIPYVRENLNDLKSLSDIIDVSGHIAHKCKFSKSAIFYRSAFQSCTLFDSKDEDKGYTVHSKDLKELFIKIAVIAYYKRKSNK